MGKTSIEWTDVSWPVVNGCRRCSPGCENCYAERLTATRLRAHPKYEGLAVYGQHGPKWTGRSRLWERDLLMPIKLRKASRIFVADMGDLFWEGVSDAEIDSVFAVMLACEIFEKTARHTFQVLTKRADRMRRYLQTEPSILVKRWALAGDRHIHMDNPDMLFSEYVYGHVHRKWTADGIAVNPLVSKPWGYPGNVFPLRNVHLGVSIESQKYANDRLPHLIKTPASARFISAEPLLEEIDISIWLYHGVIEAKPGDADFDALNWVIVGGESGPGARPFDVQWARRIVDDCKKANVACFVKQLGANAHDSMRSMVCGWTPGDPEPQTLIRLKHKKGADIEEFPKELRVRQFPELSP